MIVLSRVAFWVYDMVDAQIFQTVSVVQALSLTAYNATSALCRELGAQKLACGTPATLMTFSTGTCDALLL